MAFPFKEYEARWRAHWQDHDTFRLSDDIDSSRPKFYVLDSGPFSSFGELDAVHLRGRVAADVMARFQRMRGYSVLFPVGWDTFRLPPREQSAAAAHPPRDAAQRRMARARRCVDVLGISYDFARQVVAHDPATIRWTQRLFALLYERGLIGQETVSVWWHPELGVSLPVGELAELVADPLGHGWVRRHTRAWVVSMHEHAERLLEGLHGLCWPPRVVGNQRHIIGRCEGWYIDFPLAGAPERSIRVFTTRPDALFGASYLVLSPEHAVVDELTTELRRPLVDGYRAQAEARQEHERGAEQPETTGVFTGCYAINPATSEPIPIWVSDHVLVGYGTGAVMGIPGQNEHDWAFAETFELPIIRTVEPPAGFTGRAYMGEGTVINSGFLDGLSVAEAKEAVEEWLASRGLGGREAVSRLRPWVFSRYSTWGEPIPVYYVEDGGEKAHLVPDEELPVLLPGPGPFSRSDEPVSPLAHSTGWTDIVDPATRELGVRESATMSQWASACWRHLRHIDPDNPGAPVDPERERYFMPVDLYLCDPEYASRYLLYARFWHQALFDAGLSSVEEPFARLVCPGAVFMEPEDRPEDEPETGTETARTPASGHVPAGNVAVDSDVITDALERYGADTVRLYLLFLGPLEQPKAWDAHGLEGPHRFLHRVARLILGEEGSPPRVTEAQPTAEQWRALESVLASATEDTEALRFHTAISALMAFAHAASSWPELPRSIAEPFILALGPYAPHLAEEAWQQLGHTRSLAHAPWPELPRANHVSPESLTVTVQINGKKRATIEIPRAADECEVLHLARTDERIARYLQDQTIQREIYVPGRLINFILE